MISPTVDRLERSDMSSLPNCKVDLRLYLARVDEEVKRRKGKLPFFNSNEVRSLLQRGDGEKLHWTKHANSEFRFIEICTGIAYTQEVEEPVMEVEEPIMEETEVASLSWEYLPLSPEDNWLYTCCCRVPEDDVNLLQVLNELDAIRQQEHIEAEADGARTQDNEC